MAQNQGRLVELGDNIGHREGLTRTGNPQQRIVATVIPQR